MREGRYMREKTVQAVSWRRILQNNLFSLKYLWTHSKSYFFLMLTDVFVSGLCSPVHLILVSRLYSMLNGGTVFSEALAVICAMLACELFALGWSTVYQSYLAPPHQQRLKLKIQSEMFEKVRRMELSNYDDPAFYNDFILAMQFSDAYAMTAIGNISSVIRYVFTFAAIVGILAYVNVVVMFVVFGSAVLSMFLSSKLKKVQYDTEIAFAPNARKKAYVDRVFKLADYSKELRLTNLRENLWNFYRDAVREYVTMVRHYGKKKVLLYACDRINSQCAYLTIMGITLYKLVVLGTLTLGSFTVVVNANATFKNTVVQAFRLISDLPKQSMNLDRVRAFMEYEPKERQGTLPAPRFESIELKHVSFGYHADTPVLRDISFRLNRGEKIAIVGYNGAGKSTLIKLLMHLYEPTEGSILYNGRDFGEYELDSYRSHIGAVFQDYKIFAATVGENVMGDECTASDRATAERALHLAAFDEKLKALPRGIDTVLTREFDEDGTNLSGGEAQKIAIARVFARDCDLIIMDEPSAALDPIAEYTLNRHIAEYAADKTVIFISHRLSTTRHADRIYMLENGRIIEAGTHDELMAQDGQYAHMFRVQAKNYSLNS